MKKTKKVLTSLAIAGMLATLVPFNAFASYSVPAMGTRLAGYTQYDTAQQIAQQYASADSVLGGIIIGSSSMLVSGYKDKERIAELFEEALTIRKHYFYEHNGIRLVTWDTILRQFSVETHSNEVYTVQLNDPVSACIQ